MRPVFCCIIENMNKDLPQSEKFNQVARELEADQSDDALDRIIGKLDLRKKPEPEPKPAKK